jgi:23S rRNA (cytidine1920-2'-O)/16S rRNA (cytidine1409-2'-O)-methyltransferase
MAPARLLRRLALGQANGEETALGKARQRLRRLVDELARTHPHLDNPEARIRAGEILVDGIVRTNPETLVRIGVSIAVRRDAPLRGELKLDAALAAFALDVRDRVALDVGAAAGGFTRSLLRAGARRVYAVDAGYGQLLGSLRLDPRVVNLERTNLGDLTTALVPECIDFVTIDVSYLALADAVPQLERIELAVSADAVALVKPQFELGLARLPEDEPRLREAVVRARYAFEANGWTVTGVIESPVRGRRGSIEYLVKASRKRSACLLRTSSAVRPR